MHTQTTFKTNHIQWTREDKINAIKQALLDKIGDMTDTNDASIEIGFEDREVVEALNQNIIDYQSQEKCPLKDPTSKEYREYVQNIKRLMTCIDTKIQPPTTANTPFFVAHLIQNEFSEVQSALIHRLLEKKPITVSQGVELVCEDLIHQKADFKFSCCTIL